MFAGGARKSQALRPLLVETARRCDVAFLDAGDVVEASAVDGIHLDSESHRRLGLEVAKAVKGMFGE
jgi:hypothetical protein